jgi:hypothetical protein
MKAEMTEDGELNILDISRDQVALLAEALKESPNQQFMDDEELRRLFKLFAILQSEVYDDMVAGQFDFTHFKKQ